MYVSHTHNYHHEYDCAAPAGPRLQRRADDLPLLLGPEWEQ